MCKVNCDVEEGLIPSEKLVRLLTADGGSEEVFVSNRQVSGNRLSASEIGRDETNRVLIELPRESTSGRWRIWINADQIIG